jgi:hypothetical protein
MYRAHTRQDVRSYAEETHWDCESSVDFPDGPRDIFRDRGSGDRVWVRYYPNSLNLREVRLFTVEYGWVSWAGDIKDKKQLAYNLLYRSAAVRREIAQHWDYDVMSWWRVHRGLPQPLNE